MPSTFPSAVGTLSNPQTTDKLNSPSHATLHQNENAEIVQTQTFIGTNASAVGTLMYDIRAAASDGGGHVQTAVKGGTGQTSYTKGDVLVAQSPSVLARLALGGEGLVLTVSSVNSTGVAWATPPGSKVLSAAPVSIIASASETSLISATIPASTIGTSGVLRMTVNLPFVQVPNGDTLIFKSHMGGSSVATFAIGANALRSSFFGRLETNVTSKGTVSSQIAYTTLSLINGAITDLSVGSILTQQVQALNISFNSSTSQTMGATAKYNNGAAGERLDTGGSYIERIT